MTARPPIAKDQLPDGVYLDLDPEVYFAQERMGSSDWIKIHKVGPGWWWQSHHNPDSLVTVEVIDHATGEAYEALQPKSRQTDAQNYGSALHALLLEGPAAYQERFIVEPDPRSYKGLLTSTDEIKAALKALLGYEAPRGSSKWNKPEWATEAAAFMPGRPIWANIMADFHAVRGKRAPISAEEDRQLAIMHDFATNPDNPDNIEIRQLLDVAGRFPVLAEVSILWTDEFGIKRRARLDRPAPDFTADLKSLGNWFGRDLIYFLDGYVSKEALDIQVADQARARLEAHRMVAADEGHLHGGSEEHRTWFRAIAERNIEFDWVWLFYQKPDSARGLAPILFPLKEYWGDRHHQQGARKLVRAIRTYRENLERFGLERPWGAVKELHYFRDDHSPHVIPDMGAYQLGEQPGERAYLDRELTGPAPAAARRAPPPPPPADLEEDFV